MRSSRSCFRGCSSSLARARLRLREELRAVEPLRLEPQARFANKGLAPSGPRFAAGLRTGGSATGSIPALRSRIWNHGIKPPASHLRRTGCGWRRCQPDSLELRDQMILPRKAYAEIADERPGAWNVQSFRDSYRIEDRDPADPDAASARGEPERVERADRGIAARFGHGALAEAVSLLRRFVAEHRQVDRRVSQAGELELRIKLSALAHVGAERLPVGRLEIDAD